MPRTNKKTVASTTAIIERKDRGKDESLDNTVDESLPSEEGLLMVISFLVRCRRLGTLPLVGRQHKWQDR